MTKSQRLYRTALFIKFFTMLNVVFLDEKDEFCFSQLAPKKQLLMVLMKLQHAFKPIALWQGFISTFRIQNWSRVYGHALVPVLVLL